MTSENARGATSANEENALLEYRTANDRHARVTVA